MTSGWTMLGLGALICAGAFANGLRFRRRTKSLPVSFGSLSPRALGQLMMTVAPLFFLLWAAACFGLFGPLRNIQTIQLH